MDTKIKRIEQLISAFTSRNEKLHEEIQTNNITILNLKEELENLKEDESNETAFPKA